MDLGFFVKGIILDDAVVLRVYSGVVQGILAVADAQKAGALLEGLRTEPFDLE